ncbi:MFS transporter [Candidatus Ishikawella capsulata]|uniref:Predicted transporter n=1 Tax=Candidatus Ishikawaella capsulata Mpkobe TaxID=476281 RepID=C5WD74_9ENTR|nr:MFS transporter [Candidatus Ishikawaella capsulata]BAH83280.1 predicted transporter [Candidatus Ishikawaella capsulata Mpkobe]
MNNNPYLQLKDRDRRWILIACLLTVFMSSVEVTVVSTALPTIITKMGAFVNFGWIVCVYLLTQAVSIPLYGRLADMLGRKIIFIIGISIFLTGSVSCSLCNTIVGLICCRAFQGLGAGAIMPLSVTIIADLYRVTQRARLQGMTSTVWGISAIIGPLISAWLLHNFKWSIVFLINVPIGLVAILILIYWLPDYKVTKIDHLNLSGCLLLVVCISSLLIAVLQNNQLGYWMLLLLIISLVAGLMFKHNEQTAKVPVFPYIIWQNSAIYLCNIGNVIIGVVMMGVTSFLPTWIQGIANGTLVNVGLILAMMSIGWSLASNLSGPLMHNTSYRFSAQIGSVLLITGSILLVLINTKTSLIQLGLKTFIVGMGMGTISTTFVVSVQNHTHQNVRGICTASIMFSRIFGSALGTALMGAVLHYNLVRLLPEIHDPIKQIISVDYRHLLSINDLEKVVSQVALSLHRVFIVGLLTSLITLWIACKLPNSKPE